MKYEIAFGRKSKDTINHSKSTIDGGGKLEIGSLVFKPFITKVLQNLDNLG